jgi:hypothetical protein
MQSIKVNGIEIQFEDGIEIAIEKNGKRIVVKARAAQETIRLVGYPYNTMPWYPAYPPSPSWTFTIPDVPQTATITCGTSSVAGNLGSAN